MTAMRLFVVLLCLHVPGMGQESHTYISHATYPAVHATVYKDPKSGTLLYVETDGRHVAAISPDGKLLWSRDPFEGLPYYRMKDPQVAGIGSLAKWATDNGKKQGAFVAVYLANSQFGLLRISDGEFELEGQD